jgi:hypothetical protein
MEIVRQLAAQGKTAATIAEVVGSTTGSVRVKCCQFKIQLSRRGRPSLVPTWPDEPKREKLVIYMHPADHAALNRQAANMQKAVSELAGMLLQVIVSSNLYSAVLDE